MDSNFDTTTDKRPFAQLKNEQIEFETLSFDQNQNSEQTKDSDFQPPRIIEHNDDIQQSFGTSFIFKINPLTGQPKYTLGPHCNFKFEQYFKHSKDKKNIGERIIRMSFININISQQKQIQMQDKLIKFNIKIKGPLFLCAWSSFFVVDILLVRLIWNNSENILWFFLTMFICISHLTSYLATSTLNPGIAHRNDDINRAQTKLQNLTPEQLLQRHCKICDILKDNHTEHCDDCKVCIRGYDHHCPWSSKCIGKGNLLVFKIFIGMTFIFMVYAILITIFTLLPSFEKSLSRSFKKGSYNGTDTYNF